MRYLFDRASSIGVPSLLLATAVTLGLLDFWANVLLGPGFDVIALHHLFSAIKECM